MNVSVSFPRPTVVNSSLGYYGNSSAAIGACCHLRPTRDSTRPCAVYTLGTPNPGTVLIPPRSGRKSVFVTFNGTNFGAAPFDGLEVLPA